MGVGTGMGMAEDCEGLNGIEETVFDVSVRILVGRQGLFYGERGVSRFFDVGSEGHSERGRFLFAETPIVAPVLAQQINWRVGR